MLTMTVVWLLPILLWQYRQEQTTFKVHLQVLVKDVVMPVFPQLYLIYR